jgi:hypothetical protein
MSDERNLHMGSYVVTAVGEVRFTSQSGSVVLESTAEHNEVGVEVRSDTFASLQCGPSLMTLENSGNIFLTCGIDGKIVQTAGVPFVGPMIEMTATSLKLTVGPPGVGASITMTPLEITIKLGMIEFKMTPTGIEESILTASRKSTPIGHTLSAAESQVKVGVEGVTLAGPIIKESADAVLQAKAPLAQLSFDGLKKAQAGIAMEG